MINHWSLIINDLKLKVKKEYYIYPLLSLVSDFGEWCECDVWGDNATGSETFLPGGSLGLFIGFSFFALWDIFKDCATVGILSAKWYLLWLKWDILDNVGYIQENQKKINCQSYAQYILSESKFVKDPSWCVSITLNQTLPVNGTLIEGHQ